MREKRQSKVVRSEQQHSQFYIINNSRQKAEITTKEWRHHTFNFLPDRGSSKYLAFWPNSKNANRSHDNDKICKKENGFHGNYSKVIKMIKYLIAEAANICPSDPIVKTTMEATTTIKSAIEIVFVMATWFIRNI